MERANRAISIVVPAQAGTQCRYEAFASLDATG
jgi:hypothetical protein